MSDKKEDSRTGLGRPLRQSPGSQTSECLTHVSRPSLRKHALKCLLDTENGATQVGSAVLGTSGSGCHVDPHGQKVYETGKRSGQERRKWRKQRSSAQ